MHREEFLHPDLEIKFRELPLQEKLYEIANRAGGHVDIHTSDRDLRAFLQLEALAVIAAEEISE